MLNPPVLSFINKESSELFVHFVPDSNVHWSGGLTALAGANSIGAKQCHVIPLLLLFDPAQKPSPAIPALGFPHPTTDFCSCPVALQSRCQLIPSPPCLKEALADM